MRAGANRVTRLIDAPLSPVDTAAGIVSALMAVVLDYGGELVQMPRAFSDALKAEDAM